MTADDIHPKNMKNEKLSKAQKKKSKSEAVMMHTGRVETASVTETTKTKLTAETEPFETVKTETVTIESQAAELIKTEKLIQLSAQHLIKSYQKRHIVQNISINIRQGEIVGLLGPNGAGKTSCFYMILGISAPDKGHIFLDEKDITALPIHRRAQMGIGYLPQEASIFRKMTVEDNILAILQTRQDLDKSAQVLVLEDLLADLRISHIRNTMGISLSGGERRRVEIARALAIRPKFILLDEPFAGVDPISILDIKKIIHFLRDKGIGILITDHNVRDTLDICDRAYIMNQGKVISEGDINHILRDQHVRDVYLGEHFCL